MPKIRRIVGLPIHKRRQITLFSKTNTHKTLIKDNGTHIVNNQKINSFTELLLNSTDKISMAINKYPKINKVLMTISEKLINISEKIHT